MYLLYVTEIRGVFVLACFGHKTVICMQSVRIFSQERKHLSTMEHFLHGFSSHFLSIPNLFKNVLTWFKYRVSQGQQRNLHEFVNYVLNIRRHINEGKEQWINYKGQLIPLIKCMWVLPSHSPE